MSRVEPLVLASASPRRVNLLRAAGFDIDVVPADVDETSRADEPPREYVARVAAAKSALVAGRHPGRIVIGADTVVVVDGRMLGKPADAREAETMLRLLAGREHDVLTGVSIRRGAAHVSDTDLTRVFLAPLSDAEILEYVRSGEPEGKAGGYAIQGLASRFVTRIEGSYSNVVGLPIALVYRLLREVER